LTRPEAVAALEQAGIETGSLLRSGHIMGHAELDGVMCSGAMKGKQHTYALLDERAPQARTLERSEALAELARRYFTSHGPASVKDYVWWSGLTMTDAKAGLDMASDQLAHERIDGVTYWYSPSAPVLRAEVPMALLLPNYDEYVVGYTDRRAIYNPVHLSKLDSRGNPLFNNMMVLDGQVVGTWKRTLKAKTVVIEFNPFYDLKPAQTDAFAQAAATYGRFLGLTPIMI
jgi:hypothetical protein